MWKEKKCPNGCWSKLFNVLAALCVIILALDIEAHVNAEKMREKERLDIIKLRQTRIDNLVTFAVRCQDSAYCVISSSFDLYNDLKKKGLDIDQLGVDMYQLVHSWYHDTIDVDSTLFSALKKYKVVPQERIDFIYNSGGVPALEACFFRNNCYMDTVLTCDETRYLFDIMQRDSCKFFCGDESGYVSFWRPERRRVILLP